MTRIFDILFSFIGLLILSPVILVLLLIGLVDTGSPLFRQERVGVNQRPFKVLKFRSMHVNTQAVATHLVQVSAITKWGSFLRKSKLDELPQLFNVLIGDMSIIGPRPEVKKYVDLYTDEQRTILNVKPGITDYASIEYFDESRLLGESENPEQTYVQEIMPAKLILNKKYLDNPTVFHDLKIIWLTFKKIIS